MIQEQDYLLILSNVSKRAPRDLDGEVFGTPDRADSSGIGPSRCLPSTALWTLKDARISRVGIRITAPVKNPQLVASRLAAIALERQVLPIFLSHIAASEMQRFGFRVEQVCGASDDERTTCEEQIRRFWNLAMIVDAEDVENLG